MLDVCRSSRPEVFCKKGVLKNFGKSTCARGLFFNKVSGLGPVTLFKKRPLAQVFSCEFCEVFKNTFFIEPLWWLLYIWDWVWKWEDYPGYAIQIGWTLIEIIEIFRYSNFVLIESTSSHRRCFIKKVFLKNFVKFKGKHLCQILFIKKDALAQVFSCEYCEIFENNVFTEHLRTTTCMNQKNASGNTLQNFIILHFTKNSIIFTKN